MDLLRALYQGVYEAFNLTNRYRYDHYWFKNDLFYELEILKFKLNLTLRDKRSQREKTGFLKECFKESFAILLKQQ